MTFPKNVWVVLDGRYVPSGVYATRRAALANCGITGTVVRYVLKHDTPKEPHAHR